MNVTQLDNAGGEVILALVIDDDRLDKHFDIAAKRISQRVNIPGFRKGKAPKSILINHLGREYLLEESMRTLVPEAVNEAIDGQGLDPWSTPQVDIESLEPNVTLRARVPLKPTVELADYRAVRFDDEVDEVTEAQVDEVIESIRRRYGYTRGVDRASEQGDVVVLTGSASVGEAQLFDVTDQEFMIDPNNVIMVEGFSDALTGMTAGDEKVFQARLSRGPGGDEEEDGEGSEDEAEVQMADVRVLVSEVKEVVLPDIDDDLAKTHGIEGVETIDELRQDIKSQLEARAESQLRDELETKLLAELVDGSEFQISQIIVEREGRNLLDRELRRREAYMGRRAPKVRLDDLQPDSFEAAERTAEMNIKRALVLAEIAELEQVQITDDDVQAELDSINTSIQGGELPPLEDSPENRDSIRDNLRTRRALDLAVNIARGSEDDD